MHNPVQLDDRSLLLQQSWQSVFNEIPIPQQRAALVALIRYSMIQDAFASVFLTHLGIPEASLEHRKPDQPSGTHLSVFEQLAQTLRGKDSREWIDLSPAQEFALLGYKDQVRNVSLLRLGDLQEQLMQKVMGQRAMLCATCRQSSDFIADILNEFCGPVPNPETADPIN